MLVLVSRFFWFSVAMKINVEISFCMCIYIVSLDYMARHEISRL